MWYTCLCFCCVSLWEMWLLWSTLFLMIGTSFFHAVFCISSIHWVCICFNQTELIFVFVAPRRFLFRHTFGRLQSEEVLLGWTIKMHHFYLCSYVLLLSNCDASRALSLFCVLTSYQFCIKSCNNISPLHILLFLSSFHLNVYEGTVC